MEDLTVVTPTPAPGDSRGSHPEYIAFVLVPFFFLVGLLGVLVCHVLKKKGYRCTTAAEQQLEEEEAEAEKLNRDPEAGPDLNDTYSELNNDTVGQIVHCIMKNEANSDALKAMVNDNSMDSDGPVTPTSPDSPMPPLTPVTPVTPVTPGAAAAAAGKHTCSHLHTISGTGGRMNMCSRCNQKKWPLMKRPLARRNSRSAHGEVTVLAVGRFRVTKAPKERRTLLITDANGGAPTSPTETKSRTTSESQPQEPADNPEDGK